jgi:hypothetical protein
MTTVASSERHSTRKAINRLNASPSSDATGRGRSKSQVMQGTSLRDLCLQVLILCQKPQLELANGLLKTHFQGPGTFPQRSTDIISSPLRVLQERLGFRCRIELPSSFDHLHYIYYVTATEKWHICNALQFQLYEKLIQDGLFMLLRLSGAWARLPSARRCFGGLR